MAQVTYRGVKYDTDRNKAKQTNKVDLTYRGVRTETVSYTHLTLPTIYSV